MWEMRGDASIGWRFRCCGVYNLENMNRLFGTVTAMKLALQMFHIYICIYCNRLLGLDILRSFNFHANILDALEAASQRRFLTRRSQRPLPISGKVKESRRPTQAATVMWNPLQNPGDHGENHSERNGPIIINAPCMWRIKAPHTRSKNA